MERRQSRRDMRICVEDAQSRGVRGHAPPSPRKKKRPKSMQSGAFSDSFEQIFFKSTESTFYS